MSLTRLGARYKSVLRGATQAVSTKIHTRTLQSNAILKPWFISEEEAQPDDLLELLNPSPLKVSTLTPPSAPEHVLPMNTPSHLQVFYGILKSSPFFEPNRIRILPSGTDETVPVPAPPLPSVRQKGRRRFRGGTDFGPGVETPGMGEEIWPWLVFAQIKEGVNRRAMLNQLIGSCKKSLPDYRLYLSRDSKGSNEPTDGWTLIDAGDFAIHLLNDQAKQKWFPILSL